MGAYLNLSLIRAGKSIKVGKSNIVSKEKCKRFLTKKAQSRFRADTLKPLYDRLAAPTGYLIGLKLHLASISLKILLNRIPDSGPVFVQIPSMIYTLLKVWSLMTWSLSSLTVQEWLRYHLYLDYIFRIYIYKDFKFCDYL